MTVAIVAVVVIGVISVACMLLIAGMG